MASGQTIVTGMANPVTVMRILINVFCLSHSLSYAQTDF